MQSVPWCLEHAGIGVYLSKFRAKYLKLFGVAGTVIQWTREGKEVIYVVCTNGDKGTSDINMKPERLAEIREQEQKDV